MKPDTPMIIRGSLVSETYKGLGGIESIGLEVVSTYGGVLSVDKLVQAEYPDRDKHRDAMDIGTVINLVPFGRNKVQIEIDVTKERQRRRAYNREFNIAMAKQADIEDVPSKGFKFRRTGKEGNEWKCNPDVGGNIYLRRISGQYYDFQMHDPRGSSFDFYEDDISFEEAKQLARNYFREFV